MAPGTIILLVIVGFCVIFLGAKAMCDYIVKEITHELELRGLFNKQSHECYHDTETENPLDKYLDDTIKSWTSEMPIVDTNLWNTINVPPPLHEVGEEAGWITVEADASDAWDKAFVRNSEDIVRSDGDTVIGEAVMKTKRWERERGRTE